jgi:fibronectin type 3 domain-containing protein/nitrous oxidase accessory protein NosD
MVRKGTIGRRAPDVNALRTFAFVVGLMMVMTLMTTVSFSDSVRAGEAPLTDLTVHDPVAIDGEIELAALENVTGNGTWDDPYVIKGWAINATGSANAIMISNTHSHIIIRDCNLSYANGGGYEDRSGLRLVNVNNVTVENVTAYMNAYNGIKLDECDNITITGCGLIDNGIAAPSGDSNGIKITGCVDLSIEDCTVIGNERVGLYFTSQYSRDCVNITLRNSNISGSMWDIWTYSNRIYGFTIENCTLSDFSVAGFLMREEGGHPKQTGWFLRNLTFYDDDMVSTYGAMTLNALSSALLDRIEITHIDAGHDEGILDIRNCDNMTVTDCYFHDNVGTMVQTSYWSYDCQNITIKDSIISNCTQYGIWVDSGSVDISIENMVIDGMGGNILTSGQGIHISGSTQRISVQECDITNSNEYGVFLDSNAHHAVIRDCDISYNGAGTNDYGVYLSSFTNNVTVVNNTFTGNNGATSTYSSSHIQARDEGDGNRWNDSSGGNRWADWLEPDSNYDGIVDMPYNITGAVGAKDWLPLTDPEDIDPVVIITSPTEGELIDSLNVTIEWQAWDNQTGLDRIELTVDAEPPVDVGLNTSHSEILVEGAHTVVVTAFDQAGNSRNAAVHFTIELPTVPGAPTGLVAVPSDSSVTLNWTEPDYGGSPITLYHIYRGAEAGNLTEIDTTDLLQFTDGGLINGNTYYYAVSAENAIGEGDLSDAVPATPVNVPAAPMNLTALVNETSVELSWEEPGDNGSAIVHYNIYRGTGGTLDLIGNSTATSYLDEGLEGDTTYVYRVSAVNAVGEGALSEEAQATVIVPPDAPTDLELSLTEEGVLVEWNTYHYAVTAVNAMGEGESSSVENITYITLPGVPEDLQAEVTSEGIMITWSPPESDGGSPVTGYRIYYREGPGALTDNVSVTATQRLFEDLQAGTTYYFRVVAINSLGMGLSTGIVNATFVTAPSAPSNVQGEEQPNGILVTWSAPTEDGGLEVASYNVYRSVGDGDLLLVATVNDTEYLDTDVENDTTYNYVIKAVNANSEGDASTQYSLTFNPSEPDGGDEGIPWYLWAIPIVVIVILLLLLFLLGKRRKEKEEKKEEKKEGEE